ncbi:MAG: proline dehydrogenase family protein [Candidatus Promineifilaceae bacterium]|nr:proline dehydrogenase family protein [Candidatus Promineifilaceae bacterium]
MNRDKHSRLPILLLSLLLTLLIYVYGERWLRALLLYLSNAAWARRLVTAFPPAWYVASRFVAGDQVSDAMRATRELNEAGIKVTLDYLGESVTDPSEARAARDQILRLVERIHATGLDAGVSVKLSQLGLKIDFDLALENMRRILERAAQHDIFVRIDMEESALVSATLRLYRTLAHEEGFENSGVVIQSYLYRSEEDVRRLIESGDSVRLCKGAYKEPPEVAYPHKEDVDANFVRLVHLLLSDAARANGLYAAIATHDEDMIQAAIAYAEANDIPRDTFEFQLLYGIRRELQQELVARGYRVRVYVPYGSAWYPYFMRRLAERPANLWFFISNLLRH